MDKKILICLDLLKYPNRGLGRVSIDFSSQLTHSQNFDYTFLVPQNIHNHHLTNQKLIKLDLKKKFFSNYMKEFDVCHIIHQHPKFSFQKAKRKVLTIHDLNFLYTKNKTKQIKYHRIVQNAIYQADAICFISEFTKNDCFNHLNIPSDKITAVIYNGVNDLPRSGEKPQWCPNEEFLFSIGQFLNKKNFHVLIPFLQQLPSDIKLIIAGENTTTYGIEMKKMISERGLETRIILPRAIKESEKSYLYENCKAFVFPSIAEGFGLPVIEAMKFGKPVFCSDKTSLKEIGNKFAFFWEDFDPQNMKQIYDQGLSTFTENKNYIPDQLDYAKQFTWEKNVAEYEKIYKLLI